MKKSSAGRAQAVNHVAVIGKLLQRMDTALRRKLIQRCLTQRERLALETHIRALRAGQQTHAAARAGAHSSVVTTQTRALRNASFSSRDDEASWECRVERGCGGIYKSANANKVYGYYAKAGLKNLIFCTRIHRELTDAVRDHILLTKILEHIRSDNEGRDFPTKVQLAVAFVLDEEGLKKREFFRSVAVGISAHHWIGRVLWVHRLQLDRALDAWMRHCTARGPPLFIGNKALAAYTPKRSQEQWLRVKDAFLQLQIEDGRGSRSQIEERLRKMETAYRSVFQRKVMHFQQLRYRQQKTRTSHVKARNSQDEPETLLRSFDRVIQAWRRAMNSESRKRKCAEKQRWQLTKKMRWDGKESIADFQRRVQAERNCEQQSHA